MATTGGPPVGELLKKRLIFLLVVVAIAVVWSGLLVELVAGGRSGPGFKAGAFLASIGALLGGAAALAGALGSKRTSQQQNLGLLVLATGFILGGVLLSSLLG